MKLIDKDAVVAEIERLKNTSLEYGYNTMQRVLADSGKDISLRQLQNFINDLEVKEVDLETMFREYVTKTYTEEHSRQILDGSTTNIDSSDMFGAMCHGFELGMRYSNNDNYKAKR